MIEKSNDPMIQGIVDKVNEDTARVLSKDPKLLSRFTEKDIDKTSLGLYFLKILEQNNSGLGFQTQEFVRTLGDYVFDVMKEMRTPISEEDLPLTAEEWIDEKKRLSELPLEGLLSEAVKEAKIMFLQKCSNRYDERRTRLCLDETFDLIFYNIGFLKGYGDWDQVDRDVFAQISFIVTEVIRAATIGIDTDNLYMNHNNDIIRENGETVTLDQLRAERYKDEDPLIREILEQSAQNTFETIKGMLKGDLRKFFQQGTDGLRKENLGTAILNLFEGKTPESDVDTELVKRYPDEILNVMREMKKELPKDAEADQKLMDEKDRISKLTPGELVSEAIAKYKNDYLINLFTNYCDVKSPDVESYVRQISELFFDAIFKNVERIRGDRPLEGNLEVRDFVTNFAKSVIFFEINTEGISAITLEGLKEGVDINKKAPDNDGNEEI